MLIEALEVLGEGAVLTGTVLSATATFIIDRKLRLAATFAAIGEVLTWFGFMHSPKLGLGQSPKL